MSGFSGPGSPNDNFLQAEITASSAGQSEDAQLAPANSSHGGTGVAVAPKPGPVQSLNVKLQLAHPQPFSVYISSPDTGGVTLISVDVHIYNQLKDVFHTVVSHGEPVHLNGDDHIHIFPFTEEQLSHLLPHLSVGNMVQVKIRYRTVKPGELTIGIISRMHHHLLGSIVEHLFHSKSK